MKYLLFLLLSLSTSSFANNYIQLTSDECPYAAYGVGKTLQDPKYDFETDKNLTDNVKDIVEFILRDRARMKEFTPEQIAQAVLMGCLQAEGQSAVEPRKKI